MSNEFRTNRACIVIASHISNTKRIGHLIECLTSLTRQTMVIDIYLSISFENKKIQNDFAVEYSKHENKHLHSPQISMKVLTKKTPQMRHIRDILVHIYDKHEWVMFSDDDDTYEPNRVQNILQSIVNLLNHVATQMPKNEFVGLYESEHGKNHKEQRQEYWCYCVHTFVLRNFFKTVAEYDDILDHKCCDVFFAEYIRRMDNYYVFGSIQQKMYNYRVENNADSITGMIKSKNKIVRQPPGEITDENREQCIQSLNEYLDSELDMYLHDTYLRTIVGCTFDDILRNEFKSEYEILHLIKREHIDKIKNYYIYLREVCNMIYDTKI